MSSAAEIGSMSLSQRPSFAEQAFPEVGAAEYACGGGAGSGGESEGVRLIHRMAIGRGGGSGDRDGVLLVRLQIGGRIASQPVAQSVPRELAGYGRARVERPHGGSQVHRFGEVGVYVASPSDLGRAVAWPGLG